MKKILFYSALVSILAANLQPVSGQITSLDNLKMEKDMQFKSASGKLYWIWQYKGTCKKGEVAPPGTDIDDNKTACNGPDFDGKARLDAKVSFADVPDEEVTNYPTFLSTLPTDETMCIDLPETRTPDEMHNVKVIGLWLYAFKRQADEDYHLLVGTSKHYETALKKGFYNIEISGLPNSSRPSFDLMKKARDDFEAFFGITTCTAVCRNYVDFYQNPIKIEVTGSIFYDVDHCHKFAHPEDYPINTAWEIHPVKTIKFIE